MDSKGNKVILLGNADEKLSDLTELHDVELSPFTNLYTQYLSPFGLHNRIETEIKKHILPKRKCALKECGKEFRPSSKNECCCSKEHFILLKNKHK